MEQAAALGDSGRNPGYGRKFIGPLAAHVLDKLLEALEQFRALGHMGVMVEIVGTHQRIIGFGVFQSGFEQAGVALRLAPIEEDVLAVAVVENQRVKRQRANFRQRLRDLFMNAADIAQPRRQTVEPRGESNGDPSDPSHRRSRTASRPRQTLPDPLLHAHGGPWPGPGVHQRRG